VVTVVLVAVLAAQAIALRTRLNRLLLSPLTIVAVAFAGMGLAGSRIYAAVQEAPFGGSIRILLTGEQTEQTMHLFLGAAAAVLLGGGVVLMLAPRAQTAAAGLSWRVAVPEHLRGITLALAAGPMIAVWVAVGPANLMWRGRYLEAHVQSAPLMSMAVPLSLAACLLLGNLATSGSKPFIAAVVLLGVGYEVTYFAVGSRVFAMVPLLAAVGASFGGGAIRRRGLVLGLGASIAMLPVPLYLRAQSAHGIGPYLDAMRSYSLQDVGVDSMLRNVFISFGLVGATAFTVGALPWENFLISINPLPGNAVGWYDIASSERLNFYTPYAAMGEVGNRGVVIAFYAVVGILLGLLELRVRQYLGKGRALFALLPVALSALYVLSSFQYNLRTSTRVLLYAVAIELVMAVMTGRIGPVRERAGAAAEVDEYDEYDEYDFAYGERGDFDWDDARRDWATDRYDGREDDAEDFLSAPLVLAWPGAVDKPVTHSSGAER
jgi:hypothetical protein